MVQSLTDKPKPQRSAVVPPKAASSPPKAANGLAVASASTLTDRAYREIEEAIVTLRLKPGDILSEQMLAAATGIGRTPIREALQRLAIEGLVTILPRKDSRFEINPRSQLLVFEVRRELERMLCRNGADRATKEQRAQALQIAKSIERAAQQNDDMAFMRLDRELNQLILDVGHNEYATRALKLTQGLSRRFWYQHYRVAADLPLCARLHAAQSRAIGEGNSKAAADATDKLMDYMESFARATVTV